MNIYLCRSVDYSLMEKMPACAQYKWVQNKNKTKSQDHEFLLHTNVHFILMIFQNNNNYDNNNAKTEDNSKEKTEA